MCSPQAGSWPQGPKAVGKEHTITVGGDQMPVYISTPEGAGPWPTVVILHDYFDPQHFYHGLANHYADEGYAAVVPHLFHRQAELDEQTHEAAGARIGAVTDDGVFEDIAALLDHMKHHGRSSELALTGYCWGGRAAYLIAARFPEFKLLLPFYGHLVAWSGPDGPKPYSPLEEAGKIHARVVGSYAETDESIPLEQVREMEAKLRAAGNEAELKVFSGVGHSFFRLPEHAKESGQAWQRVLAALGETLKGVPVG